MYDIIIIGAGPAGLTAAIYALRENKKVKIIEKETIGGKIASSARVDNYPGFKSISGSEFADNLYEQVINLGGTIDIEEVTKINDGAIKEVITDYGIYKTKSIIIATGTHYNTLHLEREEDFIGNGISFCTVCDGAFYRNKDVCVIGGANSAMINAIYLSSICNKVYLIVRSSKLRGEKSLIDEVCSKENVVILYNSEVVEYLGDSELEGVLIRRNDSDVKVNASGVFMAIGQVPETSCFDNVELSDNKYICANEDCETSMMGVFVAGDVRNKKIHQLTTAISDGTVAAINAINYINKVKIGEKGT